MEEYETEDNAMLTDIPVINSTVEEVLRGWLSTTQQSLRAGSPSAHMGLGVLMALAAVGIVTLIVLCVRKSREGRSNHTGGGHYAAPVAISGGLGIPAAYAAPIATTARHYLNPSAAVRDPSEPVLISQSPREDIELEGRQSSSQAGLHEAESNLPQSDSRPDREDKPEENVQHSSHPDKDGENCSNLVDPPPNRALVIDGSPPPAYKSRPDSMASRKPSLSSDDRSTREGQGDRHIFTDGELDFPKSASFPLTEEKPSRKHQHYVDPEIYNNFISIPPSVTVGDPPAYTPSPTSSFDFLSKTSRYRPSSSNSESEQPLLNQNYNTSNNTSQFNLDRNSKNGQI